MAFVHVQALYLNVPKRHLIGERDAKYNIYIYMLLYVCVQYTSSYAYYMYIYIHIVCGVLETIKY